MFASGTQLSSDSSVQILGVRFHRWDVRQVVEQTLYWVAEKSRRTIITAGPEFVMMANAQDDVKRMAQRADLVTADGVGIVWAAQRRGLPVPERVSGVELVEALLATAETRHQPLRVYLLGASQLSLQNSLETLRSRYPSNVFSGRNGYFGGDDTPGILQEVAEFVPDLWLVGLGQPRQERFIFQCLGNLPPCVAIGVGGSIDIWGGTVKRAPRLFRTLNLEWLYRLLRQPSRWRRQLALPRFAWKAMRERG